MCSTFPISNGVLQDDSDGEGGLTYHSTWNVHGRIVGLLGHMDDRINARQREGGSKESEAEADPIASPSALIEKRSPDILSASLLAGCKKCNEDDEEQNAVYQSVRCKKIWAERHHTHAGRQPESQKWEEIVSHMYSQV
jgi:hypothetical protein